MTWSHLWSHQTWHAAGKSFELVGCFRGYSCHLVVKLRIGKNYDTMELNVAAGKFTGLKVRAHLSPGCMGKVSTPLEWNRPNSRAQVYINPGLTFGFKHEVPGDLQILLWEL